MFPQLLIPSNKSLREIVNVTIVVSGDFTNRIRRFPPASTVVRFAGNFVSLPVKANRLAALLMVRDPA
jgi:hypothetical protein